MKRFSLLLMAFGILTMVVSGLSASVSDSKLPELSPEDQRVFSWHIFEEPLVPVDVAEISSDAMAEEIRDLRAVTEKWQSRKDPYDVRALSGFLEKHPDSRWKASLLVNMATIYRRSGYFTKATNAWREAWELSKNSSEPWARRLADGALGEWVEMLAWVGRFDDLERIFNEIEGRPLSGSATERISAARQGHWYMKHRPGDSFKCGPYALGKIQAALHPAEPVSRAVFEAQSSNKGLSLTQVGVLAEKIGLHYQMAWKKPGAKMLFPCVVHWKFDHYGALIREENGRVLLQDTTLNPAYCENSLIDRNAVDEEASGYFLVAAGKLPEGWRSVDEEEGGKVWGKGKVGSVDPNETKKDSLKSQPSCENAGMARYAFHTMVTSLTVSDTPVGYSPPIGYPVRFEATYNQREATQPQNFDFGNLGPKWVYSWLAYVKDDTGNPAANRTVVLRGGGAEIFKGFSATNLVSAPQRDSGTILTQTSSNSYERVMADGSKEVYALPVGSPARKIFLSYLVDQASHTNSFIYDGSTRLTKVIDAIGQTNVISYVSTNSFLIAQVDDPFGRKAKFSYDGNGMLTNITDVIQLNSTFSYTGDFMKSMTTPYGTTSFTMTEIGISRTLEAKDPLGDREKVEFTLDDVSAYVNDPVPGNPGGILIDDFHMNDDRLSLYWDKKAMRAGGNRREIDKAVITHWMEQDDGFATLVSSGIPYYIKRPLENKVWYNYPGQTTFHPIFTSGKPTAVAKFLDDQSSQITRYEYNTLGNVTKVTDPMGRITLYNYSTNLVDLLEVRQVAGGTNDLLASFSYNSKHQPLTVVDASRQTNSFVYTGKGQVQTLTNPKGEVTTFNYNGSGYLTNVVGAVAGAVTTFGYDSKGRVNSVTDSEGYTVTTVYDDFDRVTSVTYPDGTSDQIVYSKLDPVQTTDRLGRTTHTFYNAVRQVVAVQDALDRITNFKWCSCGGLESIIDPLSNTTTWFRDLQGRVTDKVYADGTMMHYTYEKASSRLKSIQDAKGQFTQYSYTTDNNLSAVSYSNALIATPSVSFTYDTNYNRIVTMVDGVGTNTYSYYAVNGTVGSGKLQAVDGPFANDTITYTYDKLGRVASRILNGSTNLLSYDSLGRVVGVTNSLGGFVYAYTNQTTRLKSVSYPTGQSTTFDYFSNSGDQRLKTIWNKKNGGSTVSKFDYVYNRIGQITNWMQQADALATTTNDFSYDRANQLIEAVMKRATPQVMDYVYGYDKAGNRTSEQINNAVTKAIHNNVNQLTTQQGGVGPTYFEGDVSEAAQVTVGGTTATVSSNNVFNATVSLSNGTNQVSIIAVDYSGNTNTSTNKYSVVISAGVTNSLYYDLNGNLTNQVSGTKSTQYKWDARNQLVSLSTNGIALSTFVYDGLGRRVKIGNGSTTNAYVWCGTEICEQRNAAGSTVNKRYFGQGFQTGTTNWFYTFDHLGSIREVLTNSVVVARYDFDLYGRRSLVSGTDLADFGFTGHHVHKPSGLHLAMYRAYDANLGRWLSRDPIGEGGGLNLYGYVGGDPINLVDPFGFEGRFSGWELSYQNTGPVTFKRTNEGTFSPAGVRWGDAGRGAIGAVGGVFGMTLGFGLEMLPEPSLTSKVAGTFAIIKGGYAFGAGLKNVSDAFMGECPASQGSLFEDAADALAPGDQDWQRAAKAGDMAADLTLGMYGRRAALGAAGQLNKYAMMRAFTADPGNFGATMNMAATGQQLADIVLSVPKMTWNK